MKSLLQNRIGVDSADNWQDAIAKVAQPLLKDNIITEGYIKDMIDVVNTFGSYIVLAPGFCMPHAQSKENVLSSGVSILALKNSKVVFPEKEDKPIEILICIASRDSEDHRITLMKIAKILQDEEIMKRWQNTKDIKGLKKLVDNL